MENFPGYVTWSKNMRSLKNCQKKYFNVYSHMCAIKEAFNQKTPNFFFFFKKFFFFFTYMLYMIYIYAIPKIVLFP